MPFSLSARRAHCGLDGACLTGERLSLIGSIVFPQRREWVRNGIVVAASDRVDPELPVDEAWGINGCAAVLSAILAAMGSLAS